MSGNDHACGCLRATPQDPRCRSQYYLQLGLSDLTSPCLNIAERNLVRLGTQHARHTSMSGGDCRRLMIGSMMIAWIFRQISQQQMDVAHGRKQFLRYRTGLSAIIERLDDGAHRAPFDARVDQLAGHESIQIGVPLTIRSGITQRNNVDSRRADVDHQRRLTTGETSAKAGQGVPVG